MVDININEYYKKYKDIVNTCMEDKIILPFILSTYYVPKDYNIEGTFTGSSDVFKKQYFERRKKEEEIYNSTKGSKKRLERIVEYYESELINFIKKYPQFQIIIAE